jgi:hypothetical protein
MKDKQKKEIEEVVDEINSALEDSRGIESHQRRLAFSLSLGSVSLIEVYLYKKNVLKSGGKIDHRWLKKKRENVKNLIANQITCSIEDLEKIDEILDIVYKIESERNKLVYGPPVSEKILRAQIELFLRLRKKVEEND